MQVNTAVPTTVQPIETTPELPLAIADSARWRKRYLLSCLRDRRSLREIGGFNAYLAQVGWSVWWALRG